LTVDGRNTSSASASIGANQSLEVTLPGARGVAASVSVADLSGVAPDNTRYVVLNNAGRASILVVTTNGDLARDAFYLEQALLASSRQEGAFQIEAAAGRALNGWDRIQLTKYAAVVLVSTKGLERHGRDVLAQYVGGGGGMLAAIGQDVDSDALVEIARDGFSLKTAAAGQPSDLRERSLSPSDVRHPVFQVFGNGATSLALVKFQRISAIENSSCQLLARFTTGEAALIECAPEEGRLLVLASDLDNRGNNFPLHATFVPFVHEAVGYLASGRARKTDYLVGQTPVGVRSEPGTASIVDDPDGVSRTIAVNVDPRESVAGRLSADEFQAAVVRLKDVGRPAVLVEAERQEDRQHIWQYVLGLMVVLLVVESLVAARAA
jgi:hypothetical protein